MNPQHYILAIAGILLTVGVIQLMRERRQYRAKWLEAFSWFESADEQRRAAQCVTEIAKKMEKHYQRRCELMIEEVRSQKLKLANQARTITEISTTVDSLLHGTSRCAKGHRYYAEEESKLPLIAANGQRVGLMTSCPHCGASVVADTAEVKA